MGNAIWITKDEYDMMSVHCAQNGVPYHLVETHQRADEMAVVVDDKTLDGIRKYREWNNLPEIETLKGDRDPGVILYWDAGKEAVEGLPKWKLVAIAIAVSIMGVVVLISILKAL